MPEVPAKVATVLDEEQIVINVGTEDGVDVGDDVYLWNVVAVTDPDSKQPLGTVRTKKLRLEITEAQDHLSVARVYTAPLNFGSMIFRGSPGKTINTPTKSTNSVVVQRGEEATVIVPEQESEEAASTQDSEQSSSND